MLIALNITSALLVLLVAMFVHKPLEFAAFPAVVLVLTLFRLALNVSATRLVLLDGYAGKVIDTFGHFVVGGSLIVGLIVFAILLVIQFVVITKGAERVAEVGARFTLDAMPGKQMAIDADLNSGLIDEDEARRRRHEVHAEADFYGSMDGASKFVKGDAIAAIVITLVNLLGGFAVGMAQKGMSFGDAITTYSLLSVGDGLVSQIPALLLSTATGLIVTRNVGDSDMGSDILRQLTSNKLPLQIAGFARAGHLPHPRPAQAPLRRRRRDHAARLHPGHDAARARAGRGRRSRCSRARPTARSCSPRRSGWTRWASSCRPTSSTSSTPPAAATCWTGSRALRRKIAGELGIIVPPVRTRDSIDLPASTYAIRLFGIEVARGEAPRGTVLAIGDHLGALPGQPTHEPVFGLEASWIPAELRVQAELNGATVVDRSSVITTHLAEVVGQHAARLLGREDVKTLTDLVRRSHPVVIEELTPAQLSLGEVQRVLQGLLVEGVAIRDLVRIFEALSLKAQVTKDPDTLVEAARAALGPAIAAPHLAEGAVHVMSFEPMLEQRMLEAVRPGDHGPVVALDPLTGQSVLGELTDLRTAAEERGLRPVVVCAPQLRAAVRRMVAPALPSTAVLSYTELVGAHQVRSVGTVTGDRLAVTA